MGRHVTSKDAEWAGLLGIPAETSSLSAGELTMLHSHLQMFSADEILHYPFRRGANFLLSTTNKYSETRPQTAPTKKEKKQPANSFIVPEGNVCSN